MAIKCGCPFCGSWQIQEFGTCVRCRQCGAIGPYSLKPDEAWNQRVAPTADGLDRPVRAEVASRRRLVGIPEGAIAPNKFKVIIPCTSSKTVFAPMEMSLSSFKPASQSSILDLWMKALEGSTPSIPAMNLYAGKSVRILAPMALANDFDLYIISAGLGLVKSDSLVPPYDLTLVRESDSSLWRKVVGRPDCRGWWKGVERGKYSLSLREVVATNPDEIVVLALSGDYLDMIYDDLVLIQDSDIPRLRIVGGGVDFSTAAVPDKLRGCILPYTEDNSRGLIKKGSRLDLAYRAAMHYIEGRLLREKIDIGDSGECVKWVTGELAKERPAYVPAAKNPNTNMGGQGRPYVYGDEKIVELILAKELLVVSPTRGLGMLRAEGVSCSHERYLRILEQLKLKESA